jgi:hypothetical protein
VRTRLLAVFLALHGFAHFGGTSGSLKLIDQGKAADCLGGSWTVSDPTTLRILAGAWAAIGIAFLAAAAMVWRRPAAAGYVACAQPHPAVARLAPPTPRMASAPHAEDGNVQV